MLTSPCATGGAVANADDNSLVWCPTAKRCLAVRDTLAGDGMLNWAASNTITTWDGITVGGTPQRITKVYLGIQGLSGTIPADLSSLTGLTQLSIFDTQLTGPIPPELGNLTNLTSLNLFKNRLTGSIPKELNRLTNLESLELYGNQLTGPIPTGFGSLNNLEALHLDTNQLTGLIPPELGRLTNLQWLTLHDNQLTGEIPAELGRLTNLEQLWISGNQFTGCVPAELRSVASTDRTHRLRDIGIPYCDVLLNGLSISPGTLSPQFDEYVTAYTAAANESRITVFPTNLHNATFEYLDGDDNVLADADGAQTGHQVNVPAGGVTTIKVKVTSSDSEYSHIYTIQVTGPGALGAPAIDQTTPGINSLTVSWTAPSADGGSPITAYDLRHIRSDAASKTEGNWTVVQNVWTASGALQNVLTGLANGTQYDVQVRAVNDVGDGPWSATVAGSTAGTAATAPTDLTVTANGQSQIDLSWQSPASDGGAAITGYQIEVSPDRSSWNDLVADTGATGTSYSHTGLTAGSTRHYRVSAINSAGTGSASNVATATTGAASAADLVVTTPTVSESSPTAGASFTLNAAVRNQGNGSSAFTTLRYYRSGDSTITTGDTEVGTDTVFRLDTGESGDDSVSLTAPSTPGTYYYGACVDPVSGESDTRNNCSSAVTVTVGAAPAPDLVVDRPTVNESAPEAEARFTLNAAVSNQGNGSSAFTTLRYYQSTDSTITTGDTEVGTDYVSRLDASESGDESVSLTAPSTPGTYYYGACVDSVSDESNTGNNCSSSVSVTVGAAPVPDLVVDRPTVSESAPEAEARFTLNAAVSNQGNGSSAFTTLRYYQSTDSTITTGDTEVGTDYVSRLDASESGDESVSLTAPSTPGTYYYGACVDSVSDESNTGNNCSGAVTVTVSASAGVPGSPTRLTANANGQTRIDLSWRAPSDDGGATISGYRIEVSEDNSNWSDLVANTGSTATSYSHTGLTAGSTRHYRVSAINSAGTGPASNTDSATTEAASAPDVVLSAPRVSDSNPTAGASFIVNITAENEGSANSQPTTLRFYRSADSTITSSDLQMDTASVPLLGPGGGYVANTRPTAPSTPGTYYYGACVDAVSGESDTRNNCSSAVSVTVSATTSVPNSPTGLTATANGQTRINLSWRAPSDDGGATITGYRIEVSENRSGWRDLTADTGSTRVSYSHTGLEAGSTRHYRVSAINSEGTGRASGVATATTNEAPIEGKPDLIVESPTVSNTEPVAGETFTLNATVRNSGNGQSSATTMRYYRSTDSTIATHDTQVGTDTVDGLSASGTSAESIDLTAPSSAGTYYYGACVDAIGGETDTGNNCSVGAQVTVDSEITLKPDLVVDLGGLAGPRWMGESVTLSLAVRNQGNGSSTETTLRYYRSNDATISSSDMQLGTDSVRSLNAADDYDRSSISLNMPTSPGTYYYGACVDAVPGESDTTNNCSASRVDVADIADIVFSSAAVDNDTPTEGTEVTLTATVENQGEVAVPHHYIDKRSSAVSTTSPIDANRTLRTIEIERLDPSETIDVEWRFTPHPLGSGLPPTRYTALCIGSYSGAGNCSGWVAYTVQPGTSDLAVGTPTVDNSSPEREASFTLSATVRNQGSGASTETTLRYYRSTDSTITTSDTEVGTDYLRGLPASWTDYVSTSSESINLIAPSSPGTYYYGACVDSVPNETDTSNNCSSAATVTVTGAAATVPGTPTGLTATANGRKQINLAWTAPSGDGGADISGYRIEVSEDNSTWSDLVADTNSTATSYSHTGLTANSTRYYRVSAINSEGTGPVSNVANATTDAPTKPGAPTGLTATANGQTKIELSWTAPSDEGGADITGYRIEVSTDGSSWTDLVASTNSTSTSYSHTSLDAGSTRHYRVSAINSAGTGPVSNIDSATTDSAPAQESTCRANLTVGPGERCTYPGTSEDFWVDSDGEGHFLIFTAGDTIEIRNMNINGVVYTFVARKQSDGNWLVEEVG